MKSVVTAVALGAILMLQSPASLRAQAQTATPAAAAPAVAPSAAAPVAVGEKRSPSRAKQRSGERADARVCLEFPTNLQVIKCAEKYRYMRAPA